MTTYRLTATNRSALQSIHDALVAAGDVETILPPQPEAAEITPAVMDLKTGEEIVPAVYGRITWWMDVIMSAPLPPVPDGVTVSEAGTSFAGATAASPATTPDQSRPDWYTVTLVQARSVCDLQGLTPKIEALIAAMPDGPQKVVAHNAWERSSAISFDSPLLNALWPQLGLNEADRESLFRAAHAITT